MCIYSCVAKTCKGALRNAFCHWSFADNKYIFLYSCIPQTHGESMTDITIFLFGSLNAGAIDIIGNIEWIESAFRINFQDVALWSEYVCGNFALINVTRCMQHLIEVTIVETIASQTIAHVHIDYSPGSQDCFFVWISESVECALCVPLL